MMIRLVKQQQHQYASKNMRCLSIYASMAAPLSATVASQSAVSAASTASASVATATLQTTTKETTTTSTPPPSAMLDESIAPWNIMKQKPSSMSTANAGTSNKRAQQQQRSQMIKLVDAGSIGKKAVAARHLYPGEKLCTFSTPVHTKPTMHTICLSHGIHVVPIDDTEFISHACDNTNVCIKVSSNGKQGHVVVTKEVKEGEDLSFNYNTTEWDMSSPFVCACDACKAKKFPTVVRGFKHLTISERMRLAPQISPFIRSKMVEELSQYTSGFDINKPYLTAQEKKN